MQVRLLTLIVCLCVSSLGIYAHSGRTDKNGGHWDRKAGTYHYHNSGTSTSRAARPRNSVTQAPKWHYKNQTASIANLYGDTLSVAIDEEQKTLVFLRLRRVYMDTLNRPDTIKVTHRINTQPSEKKYWTWETGKVCFLESPKLVRELITKGGTVGFTVYGISRQFSLKGSALVHRGRSTTPYRLRGLPV